MSRWLRQLNEERGNALIENVIILPFIFIVIFSLIQTMFIMHDRSTVEAAAKRGAIYAAHCISDPNYASIRSASGGGTGLLDIADSIEAKDFEFSGIGSNIKSYRYILGNFNVEGIVEDEVRKIVENTRIPWRPLEIVDIDYEQKNMFLYQDLSVTITADYSIADFFASAGLETDYEYTVTATVTANDPDEFIRNADLVVDLMVQIDNAIGGKMGTIADKIGEIGTKIVDWFKVE